MNCENFDNQLKPVFNTTNKELMFFRINFKLGITGLCADQHGIEMNPTYYTINNIDPVTSTQTSARQIWSDLIQKKATCLDCNTVLEQKCSCNWSDIDIAESTRFIHNNTIFVSKHPIRMIIQMRPNHKPLICTLRAVKPGGMFEKNDVAPIKLTSLYSVKRMLNDYSYDKS